MTPILIIFWVSLIASCLTAPVNDINLNELPKDDFLFTIKPLPDTIPFLPGLRYWIANPPDFNNPLMITKFTHWYETMVLPEMKKVTPIIFETFALRDLQRASEYQDAQIINRGLLAVDTLLGRIRWSLVDFSDQNLPFQVHEAVSNWIILSNKYLYEHYLTAVMAYSEGFRRRKTVSKADGLEFIQRILSGIFSFKYAQFIHNLYETGTTIEQKIYDDFVQTENDSSFSIEKLEEFIAKYHPYIVNYEKKKSPPRFEHILGIKYTPASRIENSPSPEPSLTLALLNPDGEFISAKRKSPSTQQTETLGNPKRQKLTPNNGFLLNEQIELLHSVLAHTKLINVMLSNWLDYKENHESIDLSKFEFGLENFVMPWMKNIEILFESSLLFPIIGKSLNLPKKQLDNVFNFFHELLKNPSENFIITKFMMKYFRLRLKHKYILWKPSISVDSMLSFIKESFPISTIIAQFQGRYERLSDGRTAELIIEDNIKRFRQKSEISQKDVEQFAASNENFFSPLEDGKIMEDVTQISPSGRSVWIVSRQVGSSSHVVNIDDCVEEDHFHHDSSHKTGDCHATLGSSMRPIIL